MRVSRRLHLYVIGEPLFITLRLHDSLPPNREFPARLPSGKAFVCIDRLLDEERVGPVFLRIPAGLARSEEEYPWSSVFGRAG